MSASSEDRLKWAHDRDSHDPNSAPEADHPERSATVRDGDLRSRSTTDERSIGARPDEFSTIGEMLIAWATQAPDRVCFSFLTYRRGTGTERAAVTYGGLLSRAEAVAARVQRMGGSGNRVLILCPPGLDYIAAFFGCQLAGMAAVPAYPPRTRSTWVDFKRSSATLRHQSCWPPAMSEPSSEGARTKTLGTHHPGQRLLLWMRSVLTGTGNGKRPRLRPMTSLLCSTRPGPPERRAV